MAQVFAPELLAGGCCLALLLPLTMLLGALAAVLLPSFLRCAQRYLHGLLRQGVLLLEFVQRVLYYCKIYQQSDQDIIFGQISKSSSFSFLFGLFRCPTQSLLNCFHQDSVSITHKMIRQRQLCFVWLVCSGR